MTRMRRVVSVALVLACAACDPDLGTTVCDDGTVCPAGLVCSQTPGRCESRFCVDKPDGEQCTPSIGGPGSCAGGMCIPLTCGDGIVDTLANEECDGAAIPKTCVDGGFDYGRATCAADCSRIETTTCEYIGWHDLGLDLEPSNVNDVLITGDVTWAVGQAGIYRRDGETWARIDAEAVANKSWTFVAGTAENDVWTVRRDSYAVPGEVAHWDGSSWTVEPWNFGPPRFAEAAHGQVVVGVYGFNGMPDLVRRVGEAWVPELVAPNGSVTAVSEIEGTEVAAAEFFGGCDISGSCSWAEAIFARRAQGWELLARPLSGTIESIGGHSLSDLVFTDSGQRAFHLRQPGTAAETLTPIPTGEGWVVAQDDGYLLVSSTAPGSSAGGRGLLYRGGRALAVETPGPVRLAASSGARTVVAVGKHVFELGGSLWSEPLQVSANATATPRATRVSVADLSASPDRAHLVVLDGLVSGVSWSIAGPSTATPRAIEQPRSTLVSPVAAWSDGQSTMTISAAAAERAGNGASTLPGSGAARDIAGNAADDLMAVGGGATFARHFDGATWTPAVTGLGTASFQAVTAAGNGQFVAVGDGGLIGRYTPGHGWDLVDSGTTTDLRGVAAIDASTFVAVGARIAVRCSAGGCQRDTLTVSLGDVTMTAANDIVAVGKGQVVHHDGVAWSPVYLHGHAPERTAITPDAVWFGDTGGLERLVRVRSWRR